MKNLLLLSSILISGLAYSQCGTYQIITYSSHNLSTTSSIGNTVTSQNVMVLNNLNVTYQWRRGNNLSNNFNYSGTNTSQLTINNLSYLTAGAYECLVTNIDGCTDTAYFTVQICESISLQPVNVSTNINSNVTFTVNHPNPFATYGWQTDIGTGFQNISNAGQYSGQNTNTLVVSNVTMSNNNQYFKCKVTTACQTLNSNTVVLTINSTSSISENYNSKYSVSPNPVTNTFTINGIESLDNITSIQLKDMHGKIVKELVPDNITFDIQDLKSGVYLVEIFTNDTTETIRIVKQ